MSKTPNFDKKIQEILAATKPGERTCALTGEKWMMDEREIGWYKKFNVPPSPFSPRVRLWHLGSFFLVYQWWWNKDAETNDPVLTSIHPASGIRVLPDKKWFDRDFSDRGRDYDPAKSFFEQWHALELNVPSIASRNNVEPENSITLFSLGDKDSYFVGASTSKNCLYLNDCQNVEGSVDCIAAINTTDSYNVVHSSRLHQCKFVHECYDSVDLSFAFDCRNCELCFGAWNQRNKKYLWWNEQLTKEEWEKRVAEVDLGNYTVLQEQKKRFYEAAGGAAIWPENFNIGTDNSTGEYLLKCTDCVRSSFGRGAKHNYYCYGLWDGAEGNAFSCGVPAVDCYQAGPLNYSSRIKFSPFLVRCDDCEYCFGCYDCTECFGCVGLRHKKFHIFNKPYSEDEYWKRVDELKCAMLERREYGRPLPPKYSTSFYPEGGPMIYLGASLEDWDRIGMPRFAIDADGAFGAMKTEGKEVLQPDQVPAHVDGLDESWAGRVIMDTEIKRPFTFLKPEIAFYKKYRLAPPRQHFTARIRDLMWSMNTGLFEERTCAKCSKTLTVATNRTFSNRKIYCMPCYVAYIEKQS